MISAKASVKIKKRVFQGSGRVGEELHCFVFFVKTLGDLEALPGLNSQNQDQV